MNTKTKATTGVAPALTLMLLAPLIAEILPGATRFSSLFVLPIEICVWGGGALLIRCAVRKWQLGWLNMLLLAIALSVAEECLIQQTSLAPLVIKLKGVEYGRALGVNYVYLLWALVYESVFVVFIPVYFTELIFPDRRKQLWLNKAGLVLVSFLFLAGTCLAWFTWTRIARPKVFHLPIYTPPLTAILISVALICGLFFIALGTLKNSLSSQPSPLKPPSLWVLGIAGAIWSILWYGLVLLGFGIAPSFPPMLAVITGLLMTVVILLLLPRWTAHDYWQPVHTYTLLSAIVLASMLTSFFGFIGAADADLYFKIIVNVLATALLIVLGFRVSSRQAK